MALLQRSPILSAAFFSLLLSVFGLNAQGIDSAGENTDLYRVNPGGLWGGGVTRVDSVWLGASFLRDTTKSFKVWLSDNEAGWTGRLYLFVPHGASNNVTDTSIFLFTNHQPGAGVTLTNNPVVRAHIQHLDTIFFKYEAGPEQNLALYTGYSGPNRAPGDGWIGVDYVYSPDLSTRLLTGPVPPGRTFRVGRRWCSAGWIRNNISHSRTDTVQFAYEDNHNSGPSGYVSDFDFNDIMFKVMGVFLISPTPNTIRIHVQPDDTIEAGDTATIIGTLIDQYGRPLPTLSDSITWTQDMSNYQSGDRVLVAKNDTTLFTGTVAFRRITIVATFSGSGTTVSDTVGIYIKPARPSHVVIEASSTPMTVSPHRDNPLGGPIKTITIGPSETSRQGYAVVRDRFQNYVSFSTNTRWGSNLPGTVTASGGVPAIGEGIFTKIGPPGTARVGALDVPTSFRDSVTVVVSNATYDSLRIMQFVGTNLVRIYQLTLMRSGTATLYVQGYRSDGLGWQNVWGNWSISANLHTSPSPPLGQHSWSFMPLDTGHGTLSVSLTSGPGTSIPAVFLPGPPNVIAIFPQRGAPSATNQAWPPEPRVADTVTAGIPYSRLFAKLFDGALWLRQYEDSLLLSQQIAWSVSPTDENTLSALNGNATTLTSTRAYRNVRVTAALGPLSYPILLYVKPGPLHHLVIEESPMISGDGFIDDQPLNQLIIPTGADSAPAYAILRDSHGNFVDYSKITQWSSTDTSIISADSGHTAIGEGIAVRRADSGAAFMIAVNSAAQPGFVLRDTVPVLLGTVTYTDIRIYTLNPYNPSVDTVRILCDGSEILYVEGQRSDGHGWENVPAAWTKSLTLKTQTNPPPWSERWRVVPDTVGRGWIKATRPDAGSDSVFAIFLPGLPNRMALYRREGDPATLAPFPAIDTVEAGMTDTIVAKIFDRSGKWLNLYETFAISKDRISWTSTKVAGPGGDDTLDVRAGHATRFTPRIAYTLYQVTALFRDGAVTFGASTLIYVKAGDPHRLVIEPTPDIKGNLLLHDNPLDTLRFGANDGILNVFAILRDLYGNFVSHSVSTLWSSLDTAIVTAAEGAFSVGEGKVTRIGTIGRTKVTAVNRTDPSLIDTVEVTLSNPSYDSLRIVVRDSVDIDHCTMRYGQDTLLHVVGKRSSDGAWVPVNGNWNYVATLGSMSVSGLPAWRFAPGDTGSGRIIVTFGAAVPDWITVKVTPGPPARIVLYPFEGPPHAGNQPLQNPSQLVPVAAGSKYKMIAKVFDERWVYLADYELIASKGHLIAWNAVNRHGADLSDRLDSLAGAVQCITPLRAYDSVFVIATLHYDATHRFLDTVQLDIRPGPPKRLFIEKSPAYQLTAADPCDTLIIPGDQQSGSVFAIVRDAWNNFVGFADVKEWGSLDSAIAGVRKGNIVIGEGIAMRKVQEGETKIIASDAAGLRDSCVVRLVAYSIIRLRIIAGNDTVPLQHAVLVMNTNQDTTLYVQGMRSDTSLWTDVSATWSHTAGLSIAPVAPVSNHLWRFSPTDTGTGWIRVTMGSAVPDSLPVKFTPGPPVRVEITILTPPEKRIAGEELFAEVRIYDKDDNLFSYTFDPAAGGAAAYFDTLGRGGTGRPQPFMLVDGDTVRLDLQPWDDGKQTFVNGIDTLPFRLFFVPYNAKDSLHQIYVKLTRPGLDLRASSEPFILLPGPLSNLVLQYPNGTPIGDTVLLNYPSGSLNAIAFGYDKYTNPIGPIPSTWNTTGTLDPIGAPFNIPNISYINYSAKDATKNESGYITAAHDTISASVFVIIHGPLIKLCEAITGDRSGNGLLDHLTLRFSRPVALKKGFSFTGMTVIRDTMHLSVDGILNLTDTLRADSVWVVVLKERPTPVPQTCWRPMVYLPKFESIDVGEATIKATDGAGPVVWQVIKYAVYPDKHDNDIVNVFFSECVQRHNDGAKLQVADNPSRMFFVWEKNPLDTTRFIKIDSMLAGINNLQPVQSDSIVQFITSNGRELSRRHYLNIDTVAKYITDADQRANLPNDNNQRVRVVVIGSPDGPVIPMPNPMHPILKHPGFEVVNKPEAFQWVEHDNGGTIFSFDVLLPDYAKHPDVKVRCAIKIYDVVGNIVRSAENADFTSTFASKDHDSTLHKAAVYWNGSNSKGMIVAPGVYRGIVFQHYWDNGSGNACNYKNKRKVFKSGVER